MSPFLLGASASSTVPGTKQVLGSYVLSNKDDCMVTTQWDSTHSGSEKLIKGSTESMQQSILNLSVYLPMPQPCLHVFKTTACTYGVITGGDDGNRHWEKAGTSDAAVHKGYLRTWSSCPQTLSVSPHSTQVLLRQAHKTPRRYQPWNNSEGKKWKWLLKSRLVSIWIWENNTAYISVKQQNHKSLYMPGVVAHSEG